MIYILFFIIIAPIFSDNLYLDKFYSYMDNEKVLKFEIIVTQSQFNSNYVSKGDLYLVENNHYIYDTEFKRIIFHDDQLTTFNKVDSQILYENVISETFTIFDIFKIKKKLIDTINFRSNGQEVEIYFKIKELLFSGSLVVDKIDGRPRLIKIITEDNMNIKLEIGVVSISSKLNLKDIDVSQYSILDLRG